MVIGNICCTVHGATMVIPNDSFDAKLTLEVVEKEKCTSLYGVPTMFIAELHEMDSKSYDKIFKNRCNGGFDLSSRSNEKSGKSNEYERSYYLLWYDGNFASFYSNKIGTPFEKQIHSVGTVHDHLEIKIINPETGKIVNRGENGELCTRGYSVMLKYWITLKLPIKFWITQDGCTLAI
jgi:fatty-acyl-CoA synthase